MFVPTCLKQASSCWQQQDVPILGEKMKRIIVGIANPDETKKVTEELIKNGMKVEKTLETIGIVTGECEESIEDSLRKIDGVESIEEEQEAFTS